MFREIRRSEKITEKDQKKNRIFMMLADEPLFLRNGERNPRCEELLALLDQLEDDAADEAFDPDQLIAF